MAIFMNIYRANNVAASGLKASRRWMNAISNNLANINSVDVGKKTKSGNFIPYARQVPVFSKVLSENFRENKVNGDIINGVKVDRIAELYGDVKKVYDPSHPAARRPGTKDEGYVYFPNISLAQEMADLKIAEASYDANLSVIDTSQKMTRSALMIAQVR